MSYFRLSLLILFAYFNISCLLKQDINANAQEYEVVEPHKWGKFSGYDIEIEQLPEISLNSIDEEIFSFEENNNTLKVGLLLPLTGNSKNIGESMLNAAEMSLFDNNNKRIKLIVEDTKGTKIGAQMATHLVISKGAQIILGPVFSDTTKTVKKIAKKKRINVISFSNDWNLADKNTFLMGFMPYYQVMDVLNYAKYRGYERLAVILPENTYGDFVKEILISNNIINIVKIKQLKNDDNTQDFIKDFSGYKKRAQLLEDEIKFYQAYLNELYELDREINNKDAQKQMNNEDFFTKYSKYKELKSVEGDIKKQLKSLKQRKTNGTALEFDSILLPFGGDQLREIASLLSYYDVPPEKVKYLGTGLFDDKSLNDELSLIKAWYATPYSKRSNNFTNQYYINFKENPIRIASITYDAVSLIASLAKSNLYPNYKNLTEASGFTGIDGSFKFNKNGLIERNLSIMEIQRKGNPRKIK